jgi:hypothetical protein
LERAKERERERWRDGEIERGREKLSCKGGYISVLEICLNSPALGKRSCVPIYRNGLEIANDTEVFSIGYIGVQTCHTENLSKVTVECFTKKTAGNTLKGFLPCSLRRHWPFGECFSWQEQKEWTTSYVRQTVSRWCSD